MAFSFLLLKATDYKITVLLLSRYYILLASVKTENTGLRINFSPQNMHSVSLNKSYPSDFEVHREDSVTVHLDTLSHSVTLSSNAMKSLSLSVSAG